MTGHVAWMGEMRMYTIFWLGKLKARDSFEDLGASEKVIL
jgi:hypothetical protein